MFLIWFLNFPTLRYSGYVVVFLLIILPFCVYASKRIDVNNEKYLKKISIIIIISYSIFLYKNITRISNELNLNENVHHNFKKFPLYWTNDNNFEKINLNDHSLFITSGKCWAVPSTCVRNIGSLKILKKYNYIFYKQK